MSAGYHRFQWEDGEEFGSFEVFYDNGTSMLEVDAGWYWWACFPGCLPDGSATGPFKDAYSAYLDARVPQ